MLESKLRSHRRRRKFFQGFAAKFITTALFLGIKTQKYTPKTQKIITSGGKNAKSKLSWFCDTPNMIKFRISARRPRRKIFGFTSCALTDVMKCLPGIHSRDISLRKKYNIMYPTVILSMLFAWTPPLVASYAETRGGCLSTQWKNSKI